MNRIAKSFKIRKIKRQLQGGELVEINDSFTDIKMMDLLIDYSLESDKPIIVGNQEHADFLNLKNVKTTRLAKNFTLDIKDKQFPNGVIIHNSVDLEMIKELEQRNIKYCGFTEGEK